MMRWPAFSKGFRELVRVSRMQELDHGKRRSKRYAAGQAECLLFWRSEIAEASWTRRKGNQARRAASTVRPGPKARPTHGLGVSALSSRSRMNRIVGEDMLPWSART